MESHRPKLGRMATEAAQSQPPAGQKEERMKLTTKEAREITEKRLFSAVLKILYRRRRIVKRKIKIYAAAYKKQLEQQRGQPANA